MAAILLKATTALLVLQFGREPLLSAFEGLRQWTEAPCGEMKQYIDEAGRVRLTVDAQWAKHFYEGRAAIARDNRWGFIDESGREVIALQYSEVGSFSEGVAWVCKGAPAARSCGFIDHDGQEVAPLRYLETWSARNGVMFGRHTGGLDALSLTGRVLTTLPAGCNPMSFGEGYLACDSGAAAVIRDLSGHTVESPPLLKADGFHGGWAAVQLSETRRWTFLSKDGRLLPGPTFSSVERFSEGLAPVCKEDRWGFVDELGRMVIQPQYFHAYPFQRGRALVATSHFKGFIDRTGRMVIPDVLLEVYHGFEETGIARVILPTGYRDRNYERKRRLPAGVFPTSYPFGYIDLDGKVVWQCTPDDRQRFSGKQGK